MARLELITGFPVNEFTLSRKLFGDLYFLNCKGGLKKWGNYIKGGFLEQHFQQFSEVLGLLETPNRTQPFREKINEYREQGLEVTMHTPFIRAHNQKSPSFLGFDFEWLVVPEEYKSKPIKDFYLNNNGDKKHIQMHGLEAKLEDVQKTIDLTSEAGIEVLTLHVSAPGILLNENDWQRYTEKICGLANYAQGKDVRLAIETGGVTPEQLEKLYTEVEKRTGYQIAFNLDTAHLLLDLIELRKGELVRQGVDETEAKEKAGSEDVLHELNDKVIDFYERNKDKIKVLHLTQTGLWADLHSGIEDSLGILSCNEHLIKDANKDFEENGIKRYLMIESEPTIEGISYFIKAKNGEVTGERKTGKNESLMMFMGRPCNGKSGTFDILRDADYINDDANVIRTDVLREKYREEAHSMTEWVPREARQIVYDEGFRRAKLAVRLKQGTVFDATFDQRKNREKAYELARESGIRDFYIFEIYCEKEEAKQRIIRRDKKLSAQERRGIMPEGCLCMRDPSKYDRFDAKFEDLDPDTEFRSNGMEIHVVRVNTTTGVNTIQLHNPDHRTHLMAEALVSAYKSKFGSDYKVEVKDNL